MTSDTRPAHEATRPADLLRAEVDRAHATLESMHAAIAAAGLERVGVLRRSSDVLPAESARTNERDGVIAFLVGALARASRAQSFEGAHSIGEMARIRIAAWRAGSWKPNLGDDPADWPEAESRSDAKAPTVTVDAEMFRGLVSAAQSLEQHPERCDSKGNLWDDNTREALAMARKLGYAPQRPGPFAISSELWAFKDDGPAGLCSSASGRARSRPAGLDSGIAIDPRAPAGLDSPVAFDATKPVSPARLGGEILRLALDRARAGDVSSVCEIVHAYEILTGPRP